ncbi:hypothetical protein CYMTET_24975 [Cymbomonas tetramitiformis]|uniref:FAD dependent oxidoreductase domain-containing protein n=1 Tax=Cymbomonas tetramitiformis TaxID=36881 RepID=A0AAE0FV50_9CHLO|nr:hypothetical protein CYMTET_24975 [Cymbomonas tetramitiformis]
MCVLALWERFQARGGDSLIGHRVLSIEPPDSGGRGRVTITMSNESQYKAKHVVVAAGAWITPLAASLGLNIPTRVSEETVSFYLPRDPATAPDHSFRSMPHFIPWVPNGLGPYGYYGLPEVDVPGVKASAHYCGPTVDPDRRPPEGMQHARVLQSTADLITTMFPHLDPTPASHHTCLYTSTPDHDFVLGAHPQHPTSVFFAGGGSGHAFKFGTAAGELMARLVLGESPCESLELQSGSGRGGRQAKEVMDSRETASSRGREK